VAALYGPGAQKGLPRGRLDGFRALVAAEPTLRGEYPRTQGAGERALAETIALRIGAEQGSLQPYVLAGVVLAAERAGPCAARPVAATQLQVVPLSLKPVGAAALPVWLA
jgi:hypothetical protein